MKSRQIITRIMVGVLAICSCFGAFMSNTFASNTTTVSPQYQKMILTPGETYRNSISVFNSTNSTRDLKYSIEVSSFSQHSSEDSVDDYGSIDHISVSSYNQIMDWVKIDEGKEKGTLAPGVGADVGYTIEVPEDAPAGGQYATILVVDETTSGVGGDGNIQIGQTFQFATILYAEVAGTTREEGKVLDNSMPGFLLSGSFDAASMVRNDGNVHTDAEYILQVWPLFSDEEICTNEEKSETSLILPGTERYHAQHCNLPSMGIFKAKQVVKIFGEESIVERTIIICPLWLLFVIIFAIILGVIWIFAKSRKRRKNTASE